MILRCTKKLLAVLGAGRVAEPGPVPDAGDWYANLLWFDRRKCLLLTHAATLFSIFEADVRAVDLRATHRLPPQTIILRPPFMAFTPETDTMVMITIKRSPQMSLKKGRTQTLLRPTIEKTPACPSAPEDRAG